MNDECYECGSLDTYRKNGELNCNGCGNTYVDKREKGGENGN